MIGRSLTVCLALVAIAGVASPSIAPSAPGERVPTGCVKRLDSVASWDRHLVPVTVYQLNLDKRGKPVPVVLHSHGWAGSRETSDGAFAEFCRSGYAVVSIDMRGHGEARPTSEARVHHVEFEIRDESAVLLSDLELSLPIL